MIHFSVFFMEMISGSNLVAEISNNSENLTKMIKIYRKLIF